LLVLDSGNLRDLEPYGGDRRRAYQGRALAVVRPSGQGPISVTVEAEGIATGFAEITVVNGAIPPSIPASR